MDAIGAIAEGRARRQNGARMRRRVERALGFDDPTVTGQALMSSAALDWRDVLVQLYAHPARQSPLLVPAVAEPLVVLVVSGRAVVEERLPGGRWHAHDVTVGDFYLTRSEVPYEMRWRALGAPPFEVLHAHLSIGLIERAARDVLGARHGHVVFREVSGERDQTIAALLELLRAELVAATAGGAVFARGLARALAVHLVRRYGQIDPRRPGRLALPVAKLQRAVAAMRARLDAPLSLRRLASEVDMSPFHFSRLFKAATGLTPSRYLVELRIEKARELLTHTDLPAIAIALAVGYASPSHFAQAFRRVTGVPPSAYRRG